MARINPNTAAKVARWISVASPSAAPAEAQATVMRLRAQAERAPRIVAEITEMDEAARTAARVPVAVVDRPRWAKAAAALAEDLLGPYLSSGSGRLADAIASAEVAVGVSAISTRVLGQYDPFQASPVNWDPTLDVAERNAASLQEPPGMGRLMLVAPNIQAFQAAHRLDGQDLALWVCVHELTHAAQFAAAPWLKDYIRSRANALLELAERSPESFSLDSGPGGALTAIMSLLEGHAEYVMNEVPVALMPSKRELIAAMEARRASNNPVVALLRRTMGLDVKSAQYRDGAVFVGEVVRQVGHDGLNEVWTDPLCAPSLEEIAAPTAWIRRVLGESDRHANAGRGRGADPGEFGETVDCGTDAGREADGREDAAHRGKPGRSGHASNGLAPDD